MLVKLKDIATYINGKAFKPSEWVETGLPIIRIQNLNNPSKEYNYFDKEVHEKYIVENGDILISWSATLDIFEWKREKALLNQHIFKVVFDKEIEIDKSYFKLAISSVLHTMEKYTHGSTMKHIVKKDFENIKIPLPPLKKQKTIAKTLDKAKELIELRKESIVKLDELSRSVFVDMFGDPLENEMGWGTDKLDSFGEWRGGGTPSRKEKDYFNGDIPWITTVSLGKLLYIDSKNAIEFINEKAIEKSATKIIPIGSVIIGTRVGVGKVSINKEELCTNQDIISLVNLKEFVNNIYVCHIIKHIKKLLISEQRGATIQGITATYLRSVSLPVPPLNLQQKFAKIIQKIEAQKALYEEELEKLEYNFEALLDKSFG